MARAQNHNGIRVPRNFEHMMKPERTNQSTEYTEAAIRDYIKAHEGEVITGEDFVKASGVTTASSHLRRLMKAGRVTRRQIKDGVKGFRYVYTWHETPDTRPIDPVAQTPITTRSLNLPKARYTTETIAMMIEEVIDTANEYDAEQLKGVVTFVAKIKKDYEEVEKARAEKLKEERERQDQNAL